MEVVDRTVAGRYRLLERLGSGGMGTVWRAQDLVLHRDVAVKEVSFPPGGSEDERAVLRERTRREARAAAQLDHPSAVTVYDVAEEDGTPYLVMELVEARTLAEVVRADGPLTPQRTAAIGLAVLGALECAHQQGVVHRDVKPGNVLLGVDGRVVLTDFGIASFTGDASITSAGLLLGSPSYIAPERARGEQLGPPSDLWSLGATLFTAVEGRAPYDRGEPLTTLAAVVAGEREPYVAAGPLAPVLEGLLEADPDRRATAVSARTGLEQVLTAHPVEPASPSRAAGGGAAPRIEPTAALSLEAVAGRRPRRSRVVAPLGLAALAVLLAGGLGLLLSTTLSSGPSRPATTAPATAGSHGRQPAAAIPAGWVTRTGSGWAAAVPASYALGSFDGQPQFKDARTGRTLRVTTTPPGGGRADPVQDRRDQATAFARRYPSYQQITIAPTSYRGLAAADWEFTYADGGASLHALNRVFVLDTTGYSLFFQTRTGDDWAAARSDFDRIAASFRP